MDLDADSDAGEVLQGRLDQKSSWCSAA